MKKILLLLLWIQTLNAKKKINMKIQKKSYFTKALVMETYTIQLENKSTKPLSTFTITLNKEHFAYLKSIKVTEIKTLLHKTKVDQVAAKRCQQRCTKPHAISANSASSNRALSKSP